MQVLLQPVNRLSVKVVGRLVQEQDIRLLQEESAESDNTLVSVKHTLTLCSDRWLAAAWFDKEFMQRAAADGLVARITMATGEQIVVGWSERFGLEQPLRLKTLSFCSGSRPNDSPRVVLTLWSRDTESAIK